MASSQLNGSISNGDGGLVSRGTQTNMVTEDCVCDIQIDDSLVEPVSPTI